MFVAEVTRRRLRSEGGPGRGRRATASEEVLALAADGVDFIQLDEPVLTEVAFAPGPTRTFMCAALAARTNPTEELEFAVSLINGWSKDVGVRIGVHVCRGNWSRNETTLLSRQLPAARSVLRAAPGVPQLVLEYATERAGDLVSVPRTRSSVSGSSIRGRTPSRPARRFARRLNGHCGCTHRAALPQP